MSSCSVFGGLALVSFAVSIKVPHLGKYLHLSKFSSHSIEIIALMLGNLRLLWMCGRMKGCGEFDKATVSWSHTQRAARIAESGPASWARLPWGQPNGQDSQMGETHQTKWPGQGPPTTGLSWTNQIEVKGEVGDSNGNFGLPGTETGQSHNVSISSHDPYC